MPGMDVVTSVPHSILLPSLLDEFSVGRRRTDMISYRLSISDLQLTEQSSLALVLALELDQMKVTIDCSYSKNPQQVSVHPHHIIPHIKAYAVVASGK